jgi:replicative DNA helicase
MEERLGKYGYEFETKLLGSLIDNTEFLTQIGDILKPEYFTNDAGQWLVKKALEHYNKYSEAPSLLVFKTEIQNLDQPFSDLKESAISYLGDAWGSKNSKDVSYVQEQAVTFCKNQEIKQAILDSVDLVKAGNYEEIKNKLDAALKVGLNKSIGHIYKEELHERYAEEEEGERIPTPWDPINDIINGGFKKKKLAVVVAPSGAGKSWVLSALGADAVRRGLNVIHYTLELDRIYVGLRYDSILTGIQSAKMPMHLDKLEKIVNNLPGNVVIEEYPTKHASVLTLKAHLDRCIGLGIKPDVVIVDYADLLKGASKELRIELGQIYMGLRNLAGEYDCLVWTASQSNRSAMDEEVIQGDKISESYDKVAHADFIMSLSRKMEDKLAGTGRFHVIKNRLGPDGMTFPSKFNASTGAIDMFAASTKEAIDTRKEMNRGTDLVRKEMQRKYYDFFQENINGSNS